MKGGCKQEIGSTRFLSLLICCLDTYIFTVILLSIYCDGKRRFEKKVFLDLLN